MTLIPPHVSSITLQTTRPGHSMRFAMSQMKRPAASVQFFAGCRAVLAAAASAMLLTIAPAAAQNQPAAPASPQSRAAPAIGGPVSIPGFWDPKRRPERPDMSRITVIRFMTEVDYPPFNYAGPDGNPIGFNVDLARLICEELKVQCTVQMRRFDTLLTSLAENRGDAA